MHTHVYTAPRWDRAHSHTHSLCTHNTGSHQLPQAGQNKSPGRVRGQSQMGCLTFRQGAPSPPSGLPPSWCAPRPAVSLCLPLFLSFSLYLGLSLTPSAVSSHLCECSCLSTCSRSPPALLSALCLSHVLSLSLSLLEVSLHCTICSSLPVLHALSYQRNKRETAPLCPWGYRGPYPGNQIACDLKLSSATAQL